MPLTEVTIRNAKPREKAYKLTDSGGLYLLVQPSGKKWWRYKYRFYGAEKLMALGLYPEIGLQEARKRHFQARQTLASGVDPMALKREAKLAIKNEMANTFESVAREWYNLNLEKWTTNYGKSMLKRMENNIFPRFGSRPVSQLTSAEILDALRKVEDRGARDLTHRLSQVTSQVLNYAMIKGLIASNPALALRGALAPVVKNHRAYLKDADLPVFLKKLEHYEGHPQTKMAVKFLILTFVRTGEVRGSKWSEINFKKAEWRIPAERMKMREEHIVPLSKQALAILEEMKLHTGNREYIFPSQQKAVGTMSSGTIIYAIYRMGYLSRATAHGFRATASTILNENGFRPDVIERQLAHAERNAVRAAYNHAEYLPERREMMQWWGDYLDKAAQKRPARKPRS